MSADWWQYTSHPCDHSRADIKLWGMYNDKALLKAAQMLVGAILWTSIWTVLI